MEFLLKNPLSVAFFALGAGIIAGLYWLGDSVEEEEFDPDATQPMPDMPSFSDADEAIRWHESRMKHWESRKKEDLEMQELMNILTKAVNRLDELGRDIEEIKKGKSNETLEAN